MRVLPCNKRLPGSGCPAIGGQNAGLAILGTSEHCIATYAGDFANALLVVDAKIHVAGAAGLRTVAIADLHRRPGQTPHLETQLSPGELLVGIELPAAAAGWRSHYLKVRERTSFAFALASVAVALQLTADGTVQDARIAVGGVATTPWRLPLVEQALRGQNFDAELCREAATLASTDAAPQSRNAFKVSPAAAGHRTRVGRNRRLGLTEAPGILGSPVPRVDGAEKVTGRARYAAEFAPDGLAYAALIESTICAGSIRNIDTAHAERMPGVLLVLTHQNAPRLPYLPAKERPAVEPVAGQALQVLQDTRILFNGQPIGVVVAETQSQAEYAASLVQVEYASDSHPALHFDPVLAKPASAAAEKKGPWPRKRAGRSGERVCHRRAPHRPDLRATARTPQRHGTARNRSAVAGRHAHPLGQDAMGLQRRRRNRARVRHSR